MNVGALESGLWEETTSVLGRIGSSTILKCNKCGKPVHVDVCAAIMREFLCPFCQEEQSIDSRCAPSNPLLMEWVCGAK